MSESYAATRGPLAGVKIVEMAAIGPVPFWRHGPRGHGRGGD